MTNTATVVQHEAENLETCNHQVIVTLPNGARIEIEHDANGLQMILLNSDVIYSN